MKDDKTKPSDGVLTIDGDAAGSTTTFGSACTCGGCGTGTTCRNDTIGMGFLDSVYVYAAPTVQPDGTAPQRLHVDSTDRITFTPESLRATLQEEMLRDLLQRVQQVEKETKSLQQKQLELQGSLDALVDIMDAQDDVAEDQPRDQCSQLLTEIAKLLETLLESTKD